MIIVLGILIPALIVGYILFDINKEELKKLMGLSKNKEHLFISVSVLIGILILIGLRLYFDGLTEDFWLAMIPNLITDLVGIIIATYIINILLTKKQERDRKEKAYKMIGKKYEEVVIKINNYYINGLTREPVASKVNVIDLEQSITQTKNLTLKIEQYVDNDYFTKNIKILYFNTQKAAININDKVEEIYIDRIDFTELLKNDISKELDNFLSKYMSVLPDDLRELVFTLENYLQSNLLVNPRLLVPDVELSSISINLEDFRKYYEEMGNTLLDLLNYFNTD